jgi:TRAP-type mannitol/chloroaromatic compound transport system permease small subunit
MKVKVGKVEKLGAILSLIGLVLVFQPFTPALYTYGYYVLALGAVIFVLSGYLPKRTEDGSTYLKDLVKWVVIIAFVLLFVIGVSIMLTPYFVVR